MTKKDKPIIGLDLDLDIDAAKHLKEMRQEFRKQTATYVLAGLGLVTGLAWNDAIKTTIESFFTLSKDSIPAKFVYAIIITVLIAVAGMYINKANEKEEKKDKKK